AGGDPSPDLLVRPIGAFVPAAIAAFPRLGWRHPGDDLPAFTRPERDGGLSPAELRTALGQLDGAETSLEGTLLLVVGDPTACRQCDALLEQLAGELRPVALHTTVTGDGGALELAQPLLADRAAGAF